MKRTEKQDTDGQTVSGDLDIEMLKDEFESQTEWNMRKKFLIANVNSLTRERLVCLSRCFLNMALHGCSYPDAVKMEVLRRSGNILEKVKEDKKLQMKQKYAMSFVKESNDDDTASSASLVTVQVSEPEVTGHKCAERQWNNSLSSQTYVIHQDRVEVVDIGSDKPGASDVRHLSSVGCKDFSADKFDNLRIQMQSPKARVTKPAATEKVQSLSFTNLPDPLVQKIQKLAYEVAHFKGPTRNAKEMLHSAGNRVPIQFVFTFERVARGTSDYSLCRLFIDDVEIASGQAPNSKNAKTKACEAALQKILSPHLQVVELRPETRELQVCHQPPREEHLGKNITSNEPSKLASENKPQKSYEKPCFIADKKELQISDQTLNNTKLTPGSQVQHTTSAATAENSKRQMKDMKSHHKESNSQGAGSKHKCKPLAEFILVESGEPSRVTSSAQVLRESADFNHVLMEFEFYPLEGAVRCILRLGEEVMADVINSSKASAKEAAAARCIQMLKRICWVLKVKNSVILDSLISKDEILNEIQVKSDEIGIDNVGNQLLRKMGWSGGGMGRDGSGIAEPVTLSTVVSRAGLGLNPAGGNVETFRRRVRELLKEYIAAEKQEDIVFSDELDISERQIIHDECRKLNLRSISRGTRDKRFLCVSPKRNANQLFDYIMSNGGETAKYKLYPPGVFGDG